MAHVKCEGIVHCHTVEIVIMLVSISGDTANQTVGSSSGCFLGLLSFFEHPVALLTRPHTDLFVTYNHKYLLV